VLSSTSAAPSPLRVDDVDENVTSDRTDASTPITSDVLTSVQHSVEPLSVSSQISDANSQSQLQESLSASSGNIETSAVSGESLPDVTAGLAGKEVRGSLAPTEDSVALFHDAQMGSDHESEPSHDQEQEILRSSVNGEEHTEGMSHNVTDKSLKMAIQNSYIIYGLETRLQFRYGSGCFNRYTVELSTNWKGRSVLSRASWGVLNQMLQQILGSLPSSTQRMRLQKEKGLVQRILHSTRQKSEERSLRDMAMELRRQRDHAKDESHLANFEFYSTLIVMKSVDNAEVCRRKDFCRRFA